MFYLSMNLQMICYLRLQSWADIKNNFRMSPGSQYLSTARRVRRADLSTVCVDLSTACVDLCKYTSAVVELLSQYMYTEIN